MMLLRDRRGEFDRAGISLYAISRDHPWCHNAWSSVLELNFPLLSDWQGEATKAFDIEQTFCGLDGIGRRSAFLVDAAGVIRRAWEYDTYQVPDVDELLAACCELDGLAAAGKDADGARKR